MLLTLPVAAKDWPKYLTAFSEYAAVCEAFGLAPQPIRYTTLIAFAIQARHALHNAGVTVVQKIARVRTVATYHNLPTEEPAGSGQRRIMTTVCKHLIKIYPSTRAKRRPVLLHHLRGIVAAARRFLARVDVTEEQRGIVRQQVDMILLIQQALLRVGEAMHLRAGDVIFYFEGSNPEPVGLDLHLYHTKTSTDDKAAVVPVESRGDELDIVRRLYHSMEVAGLLRPDAASQPLFDLAGTDPRCAKWDRKIPSHLEAMKRHMTYVLRYWLTVSGVLSVGELLACYTIHSCRHGGATTLLDLGLSLEMVMRIGRWLSIAVFCYRHFTSASRLLLRAAQSQAEPAVPAMAAGPAVSCRLWQRLCGQRRV